MQLIYSTLLDNLSRTNYIEVKKVLSRLSISEFNRADKQGRTTAYAFLFLIFSIYYGQ